MHDLQDAFGPGQQRLRCMGVHEALLRLQIRRASCLGFSFHILQVLLSAGIGSRLFLSRRRRRRKHKAPGMSPGYYAGNRTQSSRSERQPLIVRYRSHTRASVLSAALTPGLAPGALCCCSLREHASPPFRSHPSRLALHASHRLRDTTHR
jgi:hypothetical protein